MKYCLMAILAAFCTSCTGSFSLDKTPPYEHKAEIDNSKIK